MSRATAGAWSGVRVVLARSRAPLVLVVLVVALAGGAALTCAAGARRTATAFDRFLAWSQPSDLALGGASAEQRAALPGVLASSPLVERFSADAFLATRVRLPDGEVAGFGDAIVLAGGEGSLATRVKVLAGRLPDPSSVDEAVVSPGTAERLHVQPGDRLGLLSEDGQEVPVRVAAVVATASLFPTVGGRVLNVVTMTPGFVAAHPNLVSEEDATYQVWLRDGAAGTAAFLAAGASAGFANLDVDEQAEVTRGVNRLVRTEALALVAAGALAALAGAVVVYQVLRRDAEAAQIPLATLRAIGVTRAGVTAGGAALGAVLGGVGAALAVVVGVAASALMPIGVARVAEPHPGVQVDLPVIGAGVVATMALVALLAAWAARRSTRRRAAAPTARSFVATWVPEPAATGVRFALAPDGRGGGRARTGLLGLGLTVAVLVGAATVGANLAYVAHRSDRSGGWWDAFAGVFDPAAGPRLPAALAAEDDVVATSRGGWLGEADLGGRAVGVMFADSNAALRPTMSRGRAPRGPHEVALGHASMTRLHASLGDEITVAVPGVDGGSTPVSVDVVGETVFAAPQWFAMSPGEGMLVDLPFVERWRPDDAAPAAYLLKLRTGADGAAVMRSLTAAVQGDDPEPVEVAQFVRPERGDVGALRDLVAVPATLAVVLAVLTTATLVHRIVTSSRCHRRDQAVLRALGSTPRQTVGASVAQASTLAAVGLVIGVPLGLLAAYAVWPAIANALAVVPAVVVPATLLAVLVAGGLAVALVLGAVLGARLWRAVPAALLRPE